MNNSNKQLSQVNNKVSVLIDRADTYFERKSLVQATYLYQEALALEPENIHALNGVGVIAMQAGMLTIAVEMFDAACDIEPDNICVNKNLALVYTRLSRYDEAIIHYLSILDVDGNNHDVYGELARLNMRVNHLDYALHFYKYAFELHPEDSRNFDGIVKLDVNSVSEDNINTIEELLNKGNLSLQNRCNFYFSLGHLYHARKKCDQAFANIMVANLSKRAVFDKVKHTEFITKIIKTFTPNLFEIFLNDDANVENKSVFIVGMPCSGQSMIEKMLVELTDNFSIGTSNIINEIVDRLDFSSFKDKNCSEYNEEYISGVIQNNARYFINYVNNMATKQGINTSPLIINNLPNNFLHLGLISLMFPNAKIIHCKRNRRDVTLSCYFENFQKENYFSYDISTITSYYDQYERLMDHWDSVLSNRIITIDYDDLIESPKNAAQNIINKLGVKGNHQKILEFSIEAEQTFVFNSHHYKKHFNTL
ncbi:MAG: sulfotransferase [Gammaproteobacteria bacterium]|nr:sulfotransferase [Gammaproteobacteria bacterium]